MSKKIMQISISVFCIFSIILMIFSFSLLNEQRKFWNNANNTIEKIEPTIENQTKFWDNANETIEIIKPSINQINDFYSGINNFYEIISDAYYIGIQCLLIEEGFIDSDEGIINIGIKLKSLKKQYPEYSEIIDLCYEILNDEYYY